MHVLTYTVQVWDAQIIKIRDNTASAIRAAEIISSRLRDIREIRQLHTDRREHEKAKEIRSWSGKVFMIYYCFNDNRICSLHCLNTGYVVTVSILAHHTIPSPTSTSGYSAARIIIRRWLKGLKVDDSKEEMHIAQGRKPKTICHNCWAEHATISMKSLF